MLLLTVTVLVAPLGIMAVAIGVAIVGALQSVLLALGAVRHAQMRLGPLVVELYGPIFGASVMVFMLTILSKPVVALLGQGALGAAVMMFAAILTYLGSLLILPRTKARAELLAMGRFVAAAWKGEKRPA